MGLFGSSGIRGLVGKDIDVLLATRIGMAVGSDYRDIVIGWDPRTSADMIVNALCAGAQSAGANVRRAGMISTPTLARAAGHFACGLMVTASHNPPEYNGVKMWNPDGSAFDTVQMRKVEDRIFNASFEIADWTSVGQDGSFAGAENAHIEDIMRNVSKVGYKVVLDCGNGATCGISPRLFERMGCEVIPLNTVPDGRFPGRPSEPSEDNLHQLKAVVVSNGADLGIAHDGDGDRMVAVDDKGRYINGDRLLALFTSLLGVGNMAAPVDASMVLDDITGSKIVRTKVGDVYVSDALKKGGLSFGGEPSGTYVFAEHSYCPDGVLAGAMLLHLMDGRQLSDLVDALPKYPSARGSFVYPREERGRILTMIERGMKELDGDLDVLDGFRMDMGDGWILVRPSGTEPKIRYTAEARTETRLLQLKSMAESIIGKAIYPEAQ